MRWLLAFAPLGIGAALFCACSDDEGQPGGVVLPIADSGVTDPDTGADAAVEAAPALKANAEQNCSADSQCQSGHCFIDVQSFCSLPCTAANATTVCVAPFTEKCNMKGFCKRN